MKSAPTFPAERSLEAVSVCDAMTTGLSHLAVIDPGTRRPVGVLASLDIARVVAGEDESPMS